MKLNRLSQISGSRVLDWRSDPVFIDLGWKSCRGHIPCKEPRTFTCFLRGCPEWRNYHVTSGALVCANH